jgi:hypothetical protein
MFKPLLAAVLAAAPLASAWAWGAEGHSIVAEIAQRRLTPEAAAAVEKVLGKGHSLASVASWADDVRGQRPETYNWHFVDIPVAESSYDPAKHCAPQAGGDCIIAALDRLKTQLACAPTDAQKLDALRFAVHFVGDIHQPMHTVDEEKGANGIKIDIEMRGLRLASSRNPPEKRSGNLHALWDTDLIRDTVWDWGAYVDRLEAGWLKDNEAVRDNKAGGTPLDWALQTHAVAATVWPLTPADHRITDDYYQKVLPLLDQQLALGGMRLARFLNEAYAPGVQCK